MCIWPFVLHVHATGTTGCHGKERRDFDYAERCSQCRTVLTPQTHVAAHVVSYPCFCLNCCIGILSLKTTCKRCNNLNRTGKRRVDTHSCMACTARDEKRIAPWIACVCSPYCFHHDVAVAPES